MIDISCLADYVKTLCPDFVKYVEARSFTDGKTFGVYVYGCAILKYIVRVKKACYYQIDRSLAPDARKYTMLYQQSNVDDDIMNIDDGIEFNVYEFLDEFAPKACAAIYDDISAEHFGCCSSFMQCSAKKKCVNYGDPEYANCSYRRNLENGRVFYGEDAQV